MIVLSFKNDAVYKSFVSVAHHHKLIDLLLWFEYRFGKVVITSAYRPAKKYGDSGIHSTVPLRALDLRSTVYVPVKPMSMATEINASWEYDPARPGMSACVYHDTGFGYHFHLQVHDNSYARIRHI